MEEFGLLVDSDLNGECTEGNPDGVNISTILFKPLSHNCTNFGFPKYLLKSFDIEIADDNGVYQRMIKGKIGRETTAICLAPRITYYSETRWNTYGSVQAI